MRPHGIVLDALPAVLRAGRGSLAWLTGKEGLDMTSRRCATLSDADRGVFDRLGGGKLIGQLKNHDYISFEMN
jgi:hypothetical protein